MLTIRLAQPDDIDEICAFDPIAQMEETRREAIRQAVLAGECRVALDAESAGVLGYAILNYHFFGNGFVELLIVHPDHRQRGVGSALMRQLESDCRTGKLFTSTNLSNQKMQSLLAKLGYRLSGVIHDLDEGDPELVYVKVLG